MTSISRECMTKVFLALECDEWLPTSDVAYRAGLNEAHARAVLRKGLMMGKVDRKKEREDYFDHPRAYGSTTRALWKMALALLLVTPLVNAQPAMVLSNTETTPGAPGVATVSMLVGVDTVVGWSYCVVHEGGMALVSATTPLVLDYVSLDLYADGFTQGAVVSFSAPGLGYPGGTLVEATYTGGGALRFQHQGLGTPPVDNLVVGLSAAVLPAIWADGSIVVNQRFERGDCLADGGTNIVDAVAILYVVMGMAAAQCNDSCDSNDDGSIDIADALFLLAHLFDGGPSMPEPFGICGADATPDVLGCLVNGACP